MIGRANKSELSTRWEWMMGIRGREEAEKRCQSQRSIGGWMQNRASGH